MRRFIYIFLLLVAACFTGITAVADDYGWSGRAADLQGVTGVGHVLVFGDISATDSYIEYTGSATPIWRDFNGALVQQGTGAETLYPEHNSGYLLYEGDSLIASFFTVDYKAVEPDPTAFSLTAKMYCDESVLTLTGTLAGISYADTLGNLHSVDRTARVTYSSLAWDGTQWQDSDIVETPSLRAGVATQEIKTEAPLKNTFFAMFFDEWLSEYGFWDNTSPAFLMSEDEYEAVAVDARPATVTTSRDYNGKGVENEPQRPITEDVLSGSAPLDINFIANANKPVAKYYHWEILKGSNSLAHRYDEEQRYTFTENGNYQVILWVYNDSCTMDSTTWDISVSESLLKVPNVFTPNGDGQNDEFRVVYRSLAEFHCWIYNRWGKLVYHWDDPAKGWDGTINGHPAAEGAYYYIIRARGTDADPGNKYHKVTKRRPADIGVYQLSGAVNLLRGTK